MNPTDAQLRIEASLRLASALAANEPLADRSAADDGLARRAALRNPPAELQHLGESVRAQLTIP